VKEAITHHTIPKSIIILYPARAIAAVGAMAITTAVKITTMKAKASPMAVLAPLE
jgi:hypothetical protein